MNEHLRSVNEGKVRALVSMRLCELGQDIAADLKGDYLPEDIAKVVFDEVKKLYETGVVRIYIATPQRNNKKD